MSLICEFCNKEFRSVSSLKYHKETAKYCLKIQGKDESDKQFKCDDCNKVFTSKNNLNYHLDSCNLKYKLLYENSCEEIEKYKLLYKNSFEEIEKYKLLYENTKDMLDKANNTIADIAKQPKNINNNIRGNQTTKNITNNILLADYETFQKYTDKERIKSIAKEVNMENYFWGGQKGIANFCNDNIIKTDKNPLLICTDPSRYRFKHLDEKGQIIEDIDARNFTYKVAEPIKEVVEEVHDGIQKDIEEKMKNKESDKAYLEAKRTQALEKFIIIRDIDDYQRNTEYKKEMSKLLNV
jgi:transposase-like protein